MRSVEFVNDMDLHSYPTRYNLKNNLPIPAKLKKNITSKQKKHLEIDSRILFTWLDSCFEGKC